MTNGRRVIMNGDEPAIEQAIIGDWLITWNPDDDRFYVQHGETVRASFARRKRGWTNALYWAKTHKA